jgi:CheY-like chemotaxis protein
VRYIVVIDDDAGVAEAMAKFLQFRGYHAVFVTSGAEGIELVLKTIPDAVVCDIRMPGLGGEQVLLMLKAQPRTCHIPVVMVTGFCSPDFVGMGDAFLVKPFKCDELVGAIEQLAA